MTSRKCDNSSFQIPSSVQNTAYKQPSLQKKFTSLVTILLKAGNVNLLKLFSNIKRAKCLYIYIMKSILCNYNEFLLSLNET